MDNKIQDIVTQHSIDIHQYEKGLKKLTHLISEGSDQDVWLSSLLLKLKQSGNIKKNIDLLNRLLGKASNKKKLFSYIRTHSEVFDFVLKIFSYPFLNELINENPDCLLSCDINLIKGKTLFLKELNDLIKTYSSKDSPCRFDFRIIDRYKKSESVRIAINELSNNIDPIETEMELSDLCEAVFQKVYEKNLECFKHQHGSIASGNYTIIALQKDGANELSYKSPINLLFIYSAESNDTSSKTKISPFNYYNQFTQNIVQAFYYDSKESIYPLRFLKQSSRTKFPIIFTIEDYFNMINSRGLALDRLQLLRTHFMAGDYNFWTEFKRSIESVVYKKYFSQNDVIEIKNFVNQTLVDLDYNFQKTIEIMIQLFQYFYGGMDVEIQRQNTWKSVDYLEKINIINEEEQQNLKKALLFLKQLHHLGELLGEEKVSICCIDAEQLDIIANGMGYCNHPVEKCLTYLLDQYEILNNQVQLIFEGHFKNLIDESNQFDFLTSLFHSPKEAEKFLARHNINDPTNAIELIKSLVPHTRNGREIFNEIFPFLLIEIDKSADPDLMLINFVKVVHSYKAKESLLELLAEDNNLFRLLCKMFSNSPFITEILIQYPGFFEEMQQPDFFRSSNSIKELKTLLQRIVRVESFEKAVNLFKNYITFQVGLKNFNNIINLPEALLELSNLAEVILFESVQYFTHIMNQEKGTVKSDLAIVLLGKLGGRELNIGSDLDIIFLYDKEQELSPAYTIAEFYGEMISKLNFFFSHSTTLGNLYEIDLKLRPEGRNSPPIHSINKFENYLVKRGAVWEKLVYTKARVISKNPDFKRKVEKIIDSFVFNPIDLSYLKKEVTEMRGKIKEHAVKKNGYKYLFKKGSGGLLDLEFLAQFLIIRNGHQNKKLRRKNLFNMYKVLLAENIINKKDYEIAYSSLIFLRKIETILRVMNNTSYEKLPEDQQELNKLAYKLEFKNKSTLLEEYEKTTDKVMSLYEKYLSG